MLNIIRMDLRRMLKNRTLYYCLFLFIILMGFCMYSQNKAQLANGFHETPTLLETGLFSWIDYRLITPLHYLYAFASRYIMLLFGIYFATYVCNEYSSGFIKNSCMMYRNRSMLIINKLCIAFLLSVGTAFLAYGICTLFGYLFVSGFYMGDMMEALSFLGILILLHFAYFTLLLLVCTMTRNKVVGIILAMMMSVGLTALFLQNILTAVHSIPLLSYTLSDTITKLSMKATSTQSMHTITVACLYLIVCSICSILIVRKRDI